MEYRRYVEDRKTMKDLNKAFHESLTVALIAGQSGISSMTSMKAKDRIVPSLMIFTYGIHFISKLTATDSKIL